jgi:cell division septation protein DedD
VQLAAVAARATADDLAAAVRAAGYEAGVVEEAGLYKVRAGPWAQRADAARALEALRARFGGQPFLVRP